MNDSDFDRDLEADLRAELHRTIVPPATPQYLRESVDKMSEQAMSRPGRRFGLPFPRGRGGLALRLGAAALAIVAVVGAGFVWIGGSNGGGAGAAPTVGPVRAVDPAVTPGPTFPSRVASTGRADVNLLDVTPEGGVFVYAKDEGMSVSLDSGVTWSEARPMPSGTWFYPVDFVDNAHGWASTTSQGVGTADIAAYRTSDSGRTWQPASVGSVTLGAKERADGVVHFLDQIHGNVTVRLYDMATATERCDMSTSDDGGATWSELKPTPCTGDDQPLTWIGSAASYYLAGTMTSDGQTIDTLKASVTLDGGRTWKVAPLPIGAGEMGGQAVTLVIAPGRLRLFVAMTPKNGADWPLRAVAYDSTDNGTTWSQAYSVRLPDQVHAVSAVGFDHWIAQMDDSSTSGTGGRLVETLDGGRTWNAMPGPGFPNVTAMRWWDDQRGVLEVYEPAPCQTNGSAAGRSGEPQVQQTNPDTCAGRTSVFVTNDGGRTWHQVPF